MLGRYLRWLLLWSAVLLVGVVCGRLTARVDRCESEIVAPIIDVAYPHE